MHDTTQANDAIQNALQTAEPIPETIEQAIERLAKLPSLEYEQVRAAEAEKLGITRVSALDKEIRMAQKDNIIEDDDEMFPSVEPWHEPVDVEQLLNDMHSTLRYYIVCNSDTAVAATLWIAFTWFIDYVQVAPIAMITAPEKRCGKSQLLTFMGKMVSRPLLASNISPAAIYRVIESHGPTLLIDEADTFLNHNEEARGIINSGHTRSTAYVIRTVGDDHEAKQFSTWGAKIICGIGKQAETLMDRSVILELRRKLPNEAVKRLRHADPLQFEIYKRQLARFALDAHEEIAASRPSLPEELNDRAQDNWEPLLAIADYAGERWAKLARNAALKISSKDADAPSLSTELLQDLKEVFDEKRLVKVKTRDLIDYLCEDDMRPWVTYNRGKPISPRQLANRLSEYGIEPKTIRISNSTPKGYERDQFEDAFLRYVPYPPPAVSATPQQKSCNSMSPMDRSRCGGVAVNSDVALYPQRCGYENEKKTL